MMRWIYIAAVLSLLVLAVFTSACALQPRCPDQYILMYDLCYPLASIPPGYQPEALQPLPYPHGLPPLGYGPHGYGGHAHHEHPYGRY